MVSHGLHASASTNGFRAVRSPQRAISSSCRKAPVCIHTFRPDIYFAVNSLARHMSRPTQPAMEAALKVVKYLHQTKDEGTAFRGTRHRCHCHRHVHRRQLGFRPQHRTSEHLWFNYRSFWQPRRLEVPCPKMCLFCNHLKSNGLSAVTFVIHDSRLISLASLSNKAKVR